MTQENLDEIYVRREIEHALSGHPDGEPVRLKIEGQRGESRWLNVSEVQVRAIRELIATATPDLEEIRRILTEGEQSRP